MSRWKMPVALLLFGFAVHPLGALLAQLLWSKDVRGSNFYGYAFATAFALAPLASFAGLAALLQPQAQRFAPLRRMLQAGALLFPLLGLAAQVYSQYWGASDAQAPLLFVFLPLYAGAAAAVLALLVFLGNLVVGASRRRPAQG